MKPSVWQARVRAVSTPTAGARGGRPYTDFQRHCLSCQAAAKGIMRIHIYASGGEVYLVPGTLRPVFEHHMPSASALGVATLAALRPHFHASTLAAFVERGWDRLTLLEASSHPDLVPLLTPVAGP